MFMFLHKACIYIHVHVNLVRKCIFIILDKDECDDPNICGQGRCRNTIGSFECTCNPGFEVGLDGKCQGLSTLKWTTFSNRMWLTFEIAQYYVTVIIWRDIE